MKEQIYQYTPDPNKPKKDYSVPEVQDRSVHASMIELTNRLKKAESDIQTNQYVIKQLMNRLQKLESTKPLRDTRNGYSGWDL